MTRTVTTSNGTTYELINNSWSTSRSWGHETNLFIDGKHSGKNRATYLNRTWESYQYRSCMTNLIDRLQDEQIDAYIDNKKKWEGIKRLSKDKRAEWTQQFKDEFPYLQEVLDKL